MPITITIIPDIVPAERARNFQGGTSDDNDSRRRFFLS
jgi:hypothetical protein